jgi:hypothetical protein
VFDEFVSVAHAVFKREDLLRGVSEEDGRALGLFPPPPPPPRGVLSLAKHAVRRLLRRTA